MSSDSVAVSCHGVDTGYDPSKPVLSGVDVAFGGSEIIAIVGGSGSGKSTLIRTMVGLLPPLSGRVELFGEDLYAVDSKQRSELLRKTGMLFQRDALFGSLSVIENVMVPLREFSDLPEPLAREVARAKLSLVGVAELADRSPAETSGGQRKRVALARALIRDPDLLFCDEPTSGLDPVTAAHIDETLLQVRDAFGVTMVVVTHDADSVRTIADRALILGGGGVCAEGTVEELYRSNTKEAHDFFNRLDLVARRQGAERK